MITADISLASVTYKITSPALTTFAATLKSKYEDKIVLAQAEIDSVTTSITTMQSTTKTYKTKLENQIENSKQATSFDDKLITAKDLLKAASQYSSAITLGKAASTIIERKISALKNSLNAGDQATFEAKIASNLSTLQASLKTNFETNVKSFNVDEFIT